MDVFRGNCEDAAVKLCVCAGNEIEITTKRNKTMEWATHREIETEGRERASLIGFRIRRLIAQNICNMESYCHFVYSK